MTPNKTDKTRPPAKPGEPQIQALMDRLDRQSQGAGAAPAKGERRWPYRRAELPLAIDNPGGGSTRVAVHPRLLWADGIAVLCPGFSYAGSACTIILVGQNKEVVAARGVTGACRHVEGTWHELEITFKQRIDPHQFIDRQRAGAAEAAAEVVDPAHLRGKVLYLDDSELDHRLLAHVLRGSGIELKTVKTPADAAAALAGALFDIFLCDLNLGGDSDGIGVVKQARAGGFAGPVVMLTAENSPQKLADAKAAGAEHVLTKPYQKAGLLQLMTKLHQQVGAVSDGETLYSTLDEQPGMEDMLGEYVAEAKRLAERVQAGVVAKSFDAVRELCLNVKGSAVGYGFAALGMAAEEALRALDATRSLDEARPQLRRLILTCGSLGLRVRQAASAPAA